MHGQYNVKLRNIKFHNIYYSLDIIRPVENENEIGRVCIRMGHLYIYIYIYIIYIPVFYAVPSIQLFQKIIYIIIYIIFRNS